MTKQKSVQTFTLPDWLYESLPYLYAVVGVASAIFVRNAIAFVSGLVLVSAGVVIWNLRRQWRARAAIKARDRSTLELGELLCRENSQALRVVWLPHFEVGHELIDRQHRRLFSIANELIDALVSGKSKADIDLILDDLAQHLTRHFQAEEDVFLQNGRPTDETHLDNHAKLLKRVRELQTKLWAEHLSTGEIVAFVAHDVITDHVTKEAVAFRSA